MLKFIVSQVWMSPLAIGVGEQNLPYWIENIGPSSLSKYHILHLLSSHAENSLPFLVTLATTLSLHHGQSLYHEHRLLMFWALWSSGELPVTPAPFSATPLITDSLVTTRSQSNSLFCWFSPSLEFEVASSSAYPSSWIDLEAWVFKFTRVAFDSWLSVAGPCLFFLSMKVSMHWMFFFYAGRWAFLASRSR